MEVLDPSTAPAEELAAWTALQAELVNTQAVALLDANRLGWREPPSILRGAPWLAAAVALAA